MGEKNIRGRKGEDPEWIKDISSIVDLEGEKIDVHQLRDLFFEYKRDGMSTREALQKAKKILNAFQNQR